MTTNLLKMEFSQFAECYVYQIYLKQWIIPNKILV